MCKGRRMQNGNNVFVLLIIISYQMTIKNHQNSSTKISFRPLYSSALYLYSGFLAMKNVQCSVGTFANLIKTSTAALI